MVEEGFARGGTYEANGGASEQALLEELVVDGGGGGGHGGRLAGYARRP